MDIYIEIVGSFAYMYNFYASVDNADHNMSMGASVSVRTTRFHHVIAKIISQDDSFIWPSLTSLSYSSFVEINNHLKHHC